MSDTITKQCNICGEDFDYLPDAGIMCVCDECKDIVGLVDN